MATLTMTTVEEMTEELTNDCKVMSNETMTAKERPSPRTADYWAFDGVILGA